MALPAESSLKIAALVMQGVPSAMVMIRGNERVKRLYFGFMRCVCVCAGRLTLNRERVFFSEVELEYFLYGHANPRYWVKPYLRIPTPKAWSL